MVETKQSIKNFKTVFWGWFWYVYNPLIILEIVCALFCTYFSIISFGFGVKETLSDAYCLIAFLFFAFFVILGKAFLTKKTIKRYFKDADNQGIIRYNIYIENNELVVNNLNKKEIERINFKNIKDITYKKRIIFIKTTVKQILFFENDEPLKCLLETIPYKNKI